MKTCTGLVEGLRAAGHRVTPQRASVLEIVAESDTHLTAEAILDRVRQRSPYLNKSTVYRSLDWLTQVGLITQTNCGHGVMEYELHRHPHHHHAICRRCGDIAEIGQELFTPLQKQLRARYGFHADFDHFAIFGTCRSCQGKGGE